MNKTIQKLLRSHYRLIDGYSSAGMEAGKDAHKVFLNANENPYAFEGLEGYNRYPEPQPRVLLEAYAKLYGAQANQVIATRGADEAIHLLVNVFCEPHRDAILICSPTFGMYNANAEAMPVELIDVPMVKQDDWDLDWDNVKDTAKKSRVKLVFVCSPNNPTGTSFDRDKIIDLCETLKNDAMIILDETYIEFAAAGSLTDVLNDHPNLVILRTLSKSYSAAGIRMGCMLNSDSDFIQLVKTKAMDAYPIPKPCIDAALTIMSNENIEIAQQNREKLLQARENVIGAFKNSSHVTHVTATDANFFLAEMPQARDFLQHCAEKNVVLRDFTQKKGLQNCIRISIGTAEENEMLMALLKSFKIT